MSGKVQRWELTKANWDHFQPLRSTRLHLSAITGADDPMSFFTSISKDIAEETIPKYSAVSKRFNQSWFTDTCKDASKERNMALERFKREPTEGNVRNYVSKINSQTSVKSVWNKICIIKGNDTSNTVHHLFVNDREVTSHCDIANALADYSSQISSSAFSTNAIKKSNEKQAINVTSDKAEVYNSPFSIEELQDTSAGPTLKTFTKILCYVF